MSWELDSELPTPFIRSIWQMPGPTCRIREIDRLVKNLDNSGRLCAEYKFSSTCTVRTSLSCCFALDATSPDVYTSAMDMTTPRKSAHHPERTLRAFDAVGIAPSLRLLNRSEVAEVLDVSLKFLDRLVRDGQIVRLKMGGKVRFRLSDVEAFLTGQAVA